MNIGDFLTLGAGKGPDKTAVVCGNVRLSYKELNRRANRFSHALLDMGLRKGSKVALLSLNSSYYPEIYYGTLKAGGIFTPVNFRLAPDEILYILENSDAEVFLFEKELASKVAPIRSRLHKVRSYICIGDDKGGDTLNYEGLISNQADTEPDVPISPADDCEILYTSGTTGRPKGVVLTHENVMFTIISAIIGRELRQGQTSLVVSPMYHVGGLNNHFGTTIALGGTAVIIREFEPEVIMETISREKVAYFPTASTIFNMLLQAIEDKGYDTSSVLQLQSGSAITPVEIKKRLTQYFPNISGVYEVYGLTETGDGITFLAGKDCLRKWDSVGKPTIFVQIKVVDDDGREVATGKVGEVIARGPLVMKGYYNNTEETNRTIRNGWLYTGDLGSFDDEGYLYIVGRKKDMIISGGENIYPREIEDVLWSHHKIADAAVIGVPDKQWGESVRAIVQLKPGSKMTEAEVIELCKRHIASYKKPKSVIFLDELPKNPSGKVLKTELREKYGQPNASNEDTSK